jgi:ParB-like chromosome segregation protein Spo0J
MTKAEPIRITVPLATLVANPKNSNVVDEPTLRKIEKNIRRTGVYPPLIVRPIEGAGYMLIDGWHRKMILERLGKNEANVEVWNVTEREADVMLATLNTLRGSDDLRLRAALVDSLMQTIPIEQLAQMLPEDEPGITDLQKLLQVDLDALEAAQTEAAKKGADEAPQPLSFVLYPEQYVKVRNALDHMKTAEELLGKKNPDGMALEYICTEYLSAVGWEAAEAKAQEALPPIGGA